MTTPLASSGRSRTRAEAVGATLVTMVVADSISFFFFMESPGRLDVNVSSRAARSLQTNRPVPLPPGR